MVYLWLNYFDKRKCIIIIIGYHIKILPNLYYAQIKILS